VHPSIPVQTLQQFVLLAKRKPGALNYASYGNGAWNHLAVELLNSKANMSMTHIPYKGNIPALADLLGGHIGVLFDNVTNAQPHVRSGKLRALAVSSTKRSPLLPDIPPLAELGYSGFESMSWIGLFAPANMPAQLSQRISSELIAVLRTQKMVDFLKGHGAEVSAMSAEAFSQLVRADVAKWRKAMQAAGLQPE
jgi:tripartite-type tricarboxylate transporter receptor subunit TctC